MPVGSAITIQLGPTDKKGVRYLFGCLGNLASTATDERNPAGMRRCQRGFVV